MKILDDEVILSFIDNENDNIKPQFSLKQIQVHIDYNCGCKITQDKLGNWLFPCKKHTDWAENQRKKGTIAKYL